MTFMQFLGVNDSTTDNDTTVSTDELDLTCQDVYGEHNLYGLASIDEMLVRAVYYN